MNRRQITNGIVLAAVLLTGFSIYTYATAEKKPQSENTSAIAEPSITDHAWTPVKSGGVLSGLKVTGRIIPQDGALAVEATRMQGRVILVLKKEGEHVTKGDAILEINSPDALSLMDEWKSAVERNIKELQDAIIQRQLQLGIRIENGKCYVISGHTGTITKRHVEVGAAFNNGDALITVLDKSHLIIECDVPESDFVDISIGQRVKIQLPSDQNNSMYTTIQNILPSVDPQTRTIKIRLNPVQLPKNIELETLVYGEITIPHSQTSMVVATSALVFYKDKEFVVKDTKQGPKIVEVRVINESENFSAIYPDDETQLHPGDKVATRGAIFLFQKFKSQVKESRD